MTSPLRVGFSTLSGVGRGGGSSNGVGGVRFDGVGLRQLSLSRGGAGGGLVCSLLAFSHRCLRFG